MSDDPAKNGTPLESTVSSSSGKSPPGDLCGFNDDISEPGLNTSSRKSQAGQKAAHTIETLIKKSVIPGLYNQFGPGMVGRRKRGRSALPPALREALNTSDQDLIAHTDWFSTQRDAQKLFDCLHQDDDLGALEIMDSIFDRGASLIDICQGLITQTMIMVNDFWEDDVLSFVEVTLLSDLLKRVLREFVSKRVPISPRSAYSCKALITTLPGEYHNIGAQIIYHNLTANGWLVDAEAPNSAHDISGIIRRKWFTLVGISVTEYKLRQACGRFIEDIRAHSRNPDVVIMLGGQAFSAKHYDAQALRADIIAHDAKHALSIAARIDKAVSEITELGGPDGRLTE